MQRSITEYAPGMVYGPLKAVNIPRIAKADKISQAVSIVKEMQFKYFFTTIDDNYKNIMEEAYQ